MRMFSRKKEDYEDDELEEPDYAEASAGEGRREFKKIKDLRSENRKKRQEPRKPWGRKERTIVLGTILLTLVFCAIAYVYSGDYSLPQINFSFPFINLKPNIKNPFAEKTIIIENKNVVSGNGAAVTPVPDISIGSLQKEMLAKFEPLYNKITKNLSGTYGVHVIDLDSGAGFGIHENEVFPAVSVIKVPVIITLYVESEKGNIDLDSQYTLSRSDVAEGSLSLQKKTAGTKVSFRELANLMAKESNNTAFAIVRKKLGDKRIEIEIEKMGAIDTSLVDNETTPQDVAMMFQKLWQRKLLNETNTREVLKIMTDTVYEMWIPRGVPVGVKVAHKVGFDLEAHIKNDAGIVMAKKPFAIAVLSEGIVGAEADSAIPAITKIVYTEMTK